MKISWPKGMERWKAVLDRYRYALLVIAVGVLLLLLPTGESRPPAEEERADGEVFFQLEELEEKLARTLSGIHGAGETEVMLTLKSGSRQVLAQDTQSRGEGERSVSTVTLGRGSGSQEVVPLQTVAPQFRGGAGGVRRRGRPRSAAPGDPGGVRPDGAGQRLHHRLPGRSIGRTAADGTAVEENRIQVEQNIVKMEEWEEFSMKTKGKNLSQLWKRNMVVAAIAVFVCAAVYLNWNYEQEVGKTLGESAMVGKEDPLVSGGGSSAPGSDGSGQTGQSDGGGTASAGGSYFDTARLNRQQSRDSALALLQEAAGKESADQTLKDEANASIQTMADYTVTEAQIENLVIAKGYTDCVAFIGENALSLAVAAPEGGLTDADTARIVDVVNQTAGFSADQVKIIAVEE